MQKVGSGSGTVTGGGISCGPTCSVSLVAGTAVTLTAAADAGSTFGGWSGCEGGSGAACDVTVGADRTVTATFVVGTGAADTGALSVTNFHCLALDELRIRRSSSPTWSVNLLASPLAPGATLTLPDLAVDTYDAQAVAATDGNSWTVNGIGVTVGGTYAWSIHIPAGTGCLTLVNNAEPGVTIQRLYLPLAPNGCSGDAWGAELLGGNEIPPDSSFTVSNLAQGPHDLWALTNAEPYRFCTVSVPGGSNTFWYLAPP